MSGAILGLSSGFWWQFLACQVPWLVATLARLLLSCAHRVFPACTQGCVQISPFTRMTIIVDWNPILLHYDLILTELIHLQYPYLQISPHSEMLRIRTSTHTFWGRIWFNPRQSLWMQPRRRYFVNQNEWFGDGWLLLKAKLSSITHVLKSRMNLVKAAFDRHMDVYTSPEQQFC